MCCSFFWSGFSVIVKFVVQCKFLGVPPFQMVLDNLFCQNEHCGSICMFLSIPYAICFQTNFCMESDKYDKWYILCVLNALE